MDSDRQQCADQILKAIEYGQLSKVEIERRLNKLIDDELAGSIDSEHNATIVELCNSLLWQLKTHGHIMLQSPSNKSKDKVAISYSAYKNRKRVSRHILYSAAAVVVLMVALTAIGLISPIRWFTEKQSDNEQQYVLEGHQVKIDTASVARAVSYHSNEEGIKQFDTISSLEDFLGFRTGFPDIIGEGFHVSFIFTAFTATQISVQIFYVNDSTETIILSSDMFTDMDQAYVWLEQETAGDYVTINDTTVYKYANVDKTCYTWHSDNIVFSVELDKIIALPESIVSEVMEVLQ